jgi:hypothetical protein
MQHITRRRPAGRRPAGDLRRCRLRIGPATDLTLEEQGIEILAMPGVLRVVQEHDGALTVDFDPRRLRIAELVADLELARVIDASIPWGLEPSPQVVLPATG